MDAETFYSLPGPTGLPLPPEVYSHSSLQSLEQCPRRWQLLHAPYPGLERYPERPSESAEIGRLVHAILGRLFWAMNRSHNPPLGSPAFREAQEAVSVLTAATEGLARLQQRLDEHPRSRGMQVKSTPRDVYNQVVQIFRDEYRSQSGVQKAPSARPQTRRATERIPVDQLKSLLKGGYALTEVTLQHPTLPLVGVIDLLERRDGQTVVVDFKTGAASEDHEQQVLLYALLWWRASGDLAVGAEVRYRGSTEAVTIAAESLEALERTLERRLATLPAELAVEVKAAVGAHCKHCPVRQFCDSYWKSSRPADGTWVDMEVVAISETGDQVFVATTDVGNSERFLVSNGGEVPVMNPGERLRFLGVAREADGAGFRMVPTTETFRMGLSGAALLSPGPSA